MMMLDPTRLSSIDEQSMHKVCARQLRHEIQCSNDQQINTGCATASTNPLTTLLQQRGHMKLKIEFLLDNNADLIWSTVSMLSNDGDR